MRMSDWSSDVCSSDLLEDLASRPGASKTAILTDALRAWLERKAGHELDERFGPRLDRQQRIAQRSETMLNAIAAMLDLFVAHQLTLTDRKSTRLNSSH